MASSAVSQTTDNSQSAVVELSVVGEEPPSEDETPLPAIVPSADP